MEERGGFEPPVVFSYSRFPGVRLRPLSHLSTAGGEGAKASAGTQQDFARNQQPGRDSSGDCVQFRRRASRALAPRQPIHEPADWATIGPSSRHGDDGSPVRQRAASRGPPTDSAPTPDASRREASRAGRAWSHIRDRAVRSFRETSSGEKRSDRVARPSPPPPPPPKGQAPRHPRRGAPTSTKKSAAGRR